VLLPLWKGAVEKVPIMGVGEILGKIPLWGTIVKRALIKRMVYSSSFIALPNRVLGKEVLPELRGDIKVEEIVERVVALLGKCEPSFNEEDFPPDAAQRLAEIVLEELYG
jgi:lipid A disaccharide synthetase